ncbi:restriction endonuclease [Bacillus cereus]|uniref:nSTAND3 domain-containing NTPase n=1 Tax=Bacillus cereus TaxID=1396 RepID=UPI0015D4E80C|nr:restriction endonuclease [Bacillus cereus]
MLNYNFLNLSPIEFEDFTRDILQKHFGIYLESFKQGKDNGIDLRYACDEQGTQIFQCKRYSDFKSLMSTLRKEVSKVQQLDPDRYIIVTSVGLSPDYKEEIKSLFDPYIKNTGDIYGQDDLNNLLGKYPEIERKYYKLWLSSVNVLEKILHNNVVRRSAFLKENILDDIKIFVQNDAFNKAIQQLNERNFVIISGNPGVGKTTLAKMLVYELMVKGFEVIEISPDIEDGFKFSDSNDKQVYYYDDFLGRNFLEQTAVKNEDKRLYNFIELIRKSKDKKLIMTTREYILNQAKQKFDLLDSEEIDVGKFVIDLSSYNNLIKAEILYNHLFFSSIPISYLICLMKDKNYKNIIEHPNYSPRVIEYMTFKLDKKSISPQDYYQEFMENLKNPSRIWKHAFENQITDLSKCILYIVLITKEAIPEQKLKESLKNLIKEDPFLYNSTFNQPTFYKALKELENAFIKINKTYNGDQRVIAFQNPSVKDFLLNYIKDDKELIKSIIKSIVYFNQLFTVFSMGVNEVFIKTGINPIKISEDLIDIIEDIILFDFDKLEYHSGFQGNNSHSYKTYLKISYLHMHYNYENEKINKLIANKIKEINISELDSWDEKETLVNIIARIPENLTCDKNQLFKSFTENLNYINDVKALIDLRNIYPDDFKIFQENNRNYLMKMVKFAISEEIYDIEREESIIESTIEIVQEIEKEFQEDLGELLDRLYGELHDLSDESYGNDNLIRVSEESSIQNVDQRIENMFDSLLKS